MRRILILPVVIFVFQSQLSAQQRQFDRPMQLIKCSIDVRANLFTATTFIEMEFYNDNNHEIEGLYTFQLKPEQVITAFQLDLNGKYRDGSIEEKWKARNAYNTIVGKRVDPALLMMNGIGQYSLNIYPVPAKGSRKITMTIDQILRTEENDLVYQLPLNVHQIVKDFKLTICAGRDENMPSAKKGLIEGKGFYSLTDTYALFWAAENIYLQKPISFSIPLTPSPVICTKPAGKETIFALRFKPSCETEFEIHPQKITVFWDGSSSARKRDINKEINFLKQFVSFHKIRQLTIIPFNHVLLDTAIFYTSTGLNSRWDDYLRDMKYEGATQLGKIDLTNFSSDIFFIFTDGNNTYGRANPITGTAHVYCVHSSSEANEPVLKKITGTSGGMIINLGKMTMSQAVSINNKGENWLMSITSSTGKTVVDQSLPVPLSKNIFLNGTLFAGNDTLIIKYGYNNRVTGTQKISLSPNIECAGQVIERITAFKRFEELLNAYDWETILEFGLKEKIVTTNTAFIVLEKVEDYIKYNITPPKDLEKECEDLQYVKKDTRLQRQQMKLADDFEVLDQIVKTYNNKIRRWDSKASIIELTRTEFENALADRGETNSPVSQSPTVQPASLSDISFGTTKASLSEVVVVGYGTEQKRSLTGSVTTVRGSELSLGSMNVESALAGKVAGLAVTRSQGFQPGLMNSVKIRGAGSINGNGEPLYVLDGTPVSGNINDLINLNDIESISVFKDIQASALFGSRASNGAIVITSKKKNRNWYNYYNNKPYRLKDMEDVEYISDMKEKSSTEKYQLYLQLQETYEGQPGFHFDIAQHFFEEGLKNEAYKILMNAAEESKGHMQALRAVGFILESWKWFDRAIEVYESLVENYPSYPDTRRNLALAYYQNGNYQQAIITLYNAIKDNVYDTEYWKIPLKATMLIEMNAIIALHKDSLNVDFIPPSLIRPLPVDLRIVVESNGSSLGNVSVKEPGGEICSYTKPVTKNGFIDYNYSGYFTPLEYQTKKAKEGKYKISVNYYGRNSWHYDIPDFIRIITFKNFAKTGQQIKIDNVIMDNQYGEVEIGEVKW